MISKPIEIPGLDIDNLPPATEHTAAVVIDPRGLVGMPPGCTHPQALIDMDYIGKPEDPVVYKCKCGARWVEITTPITLDNLPRHPLQEEDGAFWRAIREPSDPKGWRWQPLNLKAFGKTGPTGPMTDYYRPRQEEPHA